MSMDQSIMPPAKGIPGENCETCGQRLSPLSGWQVERDCDKCGKVIYVAEAGEGGKGLKVEKGDRFHISADTIRLSLDRTKATGQFSRAGVSWFVDLLHTQGLAGTVEDIDKQLAYYDEQATNALKASPRLSSIDFDSETATDEIYRVLENQQNTSEYAAFWVTMMVERVREGIAKGEAQKAAWLMGQLGVARALFLYRDNLEETLWRGYTLGGLKDVLNVWLANRDNADEEFWQKLLRDNTVVLSQVFSFPVIVLEDKAYLGGKGIENSGGKVLDYLLTNEMTDNVALVEIKTPVAKLLGSKYRGGVYSVSDELTGAIGQVSTYKDTLLKEYTVRVHNSEKMFQAFNPQCLVIAGTLEGQVTDKAQRRSFELFRQGLRDVQIITFDELFHKVAILVTLLEAESTSEKLDTNTPLFDSSIVTTGQNMPASKVSLT